MPVRPTIPYRNIFNKYPPCYNPYKVITEYDMDKCERIHGTCRCFRQVYDIIYVDQPTRVKEFERYITNV